MDYLAIENIIETRLMNNDGLSRRGVKDAALCLMLNPNDTWARLCLIMYSRPELADNSDSKSLAIQSRFATRIAHSIHKYDRERSPLLKFLLRLATFAELDVCGYTKKLGASDAGIGYDVCADSDVRLDYADSNGLEYYDEGVIRAESYLANLIYEKPFGETIKFPLFEKDSDGKITPITPTIKMSAEELKSTLVLLLQNEQRIRDLIALYRPCATALNPAVILPGFAEYYAARYKTDKGLKEQPLYELVFEMMILGKSDLDEVEAEYRKRHNSEEPPVKAKQARYSERGKRILAGFWDWLDETQNN
ncbi:MAG: hypothetical protein LBL96_04605 [Clostridiales bacterium]|jgi:hypothetical protein|nr:hypothetical protein [Clostridiales bacterium]